MVKLIIAAAVALVGVVAGGVAAQVDAPAWLIAVAGMASTAAAAWRGREAIDTLVAKLPLTVRREIVAYGLVFIGFVNSGQLAAFSLPAWLHVAAGVLVLLAGLLGIRSEATPVSFPRSRDGAPLVPQWGVSASASGGSFATGGIVPGAIGEARTIVAHGGEKVVPTSPSGGGSKATRTRVTRRKPSS